MTNTMQVTFRDENIKQTMIDIVSKANISIASDTVDIVVVELPDNGKSGAKDDQPEWSKPIESGKRVETNIRVWLSGAPIEDAIRELTQKTDENVEPEEFCDSIEQLLRKNENETVFSSIKPVKSGMGPSSARKYFLLIIVRLKEETSGYAELAKYIVEDVKGKLDSAGDFLKMSATERGRKNLFGNIRKNWILLVNFVEYYMEKNCLPDSEVMTSLSAASYEGSESEARIYFTHRALNTVEVFHAEGKEDRAINGDNLRMLRKLMEISKRNALYLYAERKGKEKLYTISSLVQSRKRTEEDIYVKFSGFMHWSFFEGEREIFSYYHGKYAINASKEDRAYVKEIDELKNVDKQMISRLVEILIRQKHGAVAVLFDQKTDAVTEVDRLCKMKRGIRICSNICYDKEKGWDEEQILSVTGIDGALFIDYEGRCLAIGVIVDGRIEIEGNAGRGARYNSIVNYMGLNPDCVGIVVSEDGMVDVIQNPENPAALDSKIR